LKLANPAFRKQPGFQLPWEHPNPNSLQVIKWAWSLADEQGNAHQKYDFSLSADWDRMLFLPHG